MRFTSVLILLCAGCLTVLGQEFTSSNLPIIVIETPLDTYISDEPKLTADMGIIDNGPGQRNNLTDSFNGYNGKIGIEYRGSSSQGFPKKPYGFETRDAEGQGVDVSLLGMPAEEDWCLIATYNDKSLVRDALAYKLGRDLGRYAPRTRFCELVLVTNRTSGGNPTKTYEYQGVYMLTEKIKRDKNRVDIAKLDPDEISGDDLTGGYILKIDKFTGNSSYGFASSYAPTPRSASQNISFQFDYPEFDEIKQQQRQYIKGFIDQFERVLAGATYDDEVNGYSKYIDVASFVDFLIVNEISRNVDGYRLSTYMHKDKESNGGKLVMGPVWDFNLGFGNADYCSGAKRSGWSYDFNNECNGDEWLVPFWWARLMTDFNFRQALAARWEELRADKFSNGKLTTYIDSVTEVLGAEAAGRNFTKWPVLGQYVWPNVFIGETYGAEVNYLKSWLFDRLQWLDNNMPRRITTSSEQQFDAAPFSITAHPNPFQSEINFTYVIDRPDIMTIELIDAMGRKINQVRVRHDKPGEHQVAMKNINIGGGVFYFKATSSTAKNAVSGRVVKLTN